MKPVTKDIRRVGAKKCMDLTVLGREYMDLMVLGHAGCAVSGVVVNLLWNRVRAPVLGMIGSVQDKVWQQIARPK